MWIPKQEGSRSLGMVNAHKTPPPLCTCMYVTRYMYVCDLFARKVIIAGVCTEGDINA